MANGKTKFGENFKYLQEFVFELPKKNNNIDFLSEAMNVLILQ